MCQRPVPPGLGLGLGLGPRLRLRSGSGETSPSISTCSDGSSQSNDDEHSRSSSMHSINQALSRVRRRLAASRISALSLGTGAVSEQPDVFRAMLADDSLKSIAQKEMYPVLHDGVQTLIAWADDFECERLTREDGESFLHLWISTLCSSFVNVFDTSETLRRSRSLSDLHTTWPAVPTVLSDVQEEDEADQGGTVIPRMSGRFPQ